MAPVSNTTPTGAISTRKGFLGQRRKAKFILRSIIILLGILVAIMSAVDFAKYPPNYYDNGHGQFVLVVLVPGAGCAVIWSLIDIILLLVRGGTIGMHPLAVAIVDMIVIVGSVIELIMLLVFRSVDYEGTAPLNRYYEGDEYMWPAFVFHLLLLLTVIPVFCISVSENNARRHAKQTSINKTMP